MATVTNLDIPPLPCQVMYDTANGIIGANSNASVVVRGPSIIQVEAVPAATTVKIQQKIHKDAAWSDVGSPIAGATVIPTIVTFAVPPNFVQIVRTGGAGAVLAYAQMAPIER